MTTRDEIQKELFVCNKCNYSPNHEFDCIVRNEDLLGKYEVDIWFIGINPHYSLNDLECFLRKRLHCKKLGSKELTLKFWKERAIHYFDQHITDKQNNFTVDLCGNYYNYRMEPYDYFYYINKETVLEFGKNCAHLDFFKIATSNINRLNELIKRNPKISKCPEIHFFKQLEIHKPKLFIMTGDATRQWFRNSSSSNFDTMNNPDVFSNKGITKLRFKEVIWNLNGERFKVLFCPSFSRRWREKFWEVSDKAKINEFNAIVSRFLS